MLCLAVVPSKEQLEEGQIGQLVRRPPTGGPAGLPHGPESLAGRGSGAVARSTQELV